MKGPDKWLAALLLFTLIILPLSSRGKTEQRQILSGRIRLVGSQPLTKLVLTVDEERDYIIPPELSSDFMPFLGSLLTLETAIKEEQWELADRSHKVTFYYLHEPEILTIGQ